MPRGDPRCNRTDSLIISRKAGTCLHLFIITMGKRVLACQMRGLPHAFAAEVKVEGGFAHACPTEGLGVGDDCQEMWVSVHDPSLKRRITISLSRSAACERSSPNQDEQITLRAISDVDEFFFLQLAPLPESANILTSIKYEPQKHGTLKSDFTAARGLSREQTLVRLYDKKWLPLQGHGSTTRKSCAIYVPMTSQQSSTYITVLAVRIQDSPGCMARQGTIQRKRKRNPHAEKKKTSRRSSKRAEHTTNSDQRSTPSAAVSIYSRHGT